MVLPVIPTHSPRTRQTEPSHGRSLRHFRRRPRALNSKPFSGSLFCRSTQSLFLPVGPGLQSTPAPRPKKGTRGLRRKKIESRGIKTRHQHGRNPRTRISKKGRTHLWRGLSLTNLVWIVAQMVLDWPKRVAQLRKSASGIHCRIQPVLAPLEPAAKRRRGERIETC